MITGKKIEPASTKYWKPTANRFVGFIDIMGFKDMVARNNHDDIYKMMKKLRKSLEFTEDMFGKSFTEYGEDMFVKMTTYSDSIIIYSKDDTDESLESFFTSIACLHEDLFSLKIPHKGAIAFGKMTLDQDNSIFFGQPLIDAFQLQEEVRFYGIVCHASAENKIKGNPNDIYLYEHLCHFKEGRAKHLAICPMALDKKGGRTEIEISNLKSITSGHLRKYIDNTMEFIKAVKPIVKS